MAAWGPKTPLFGPVEIPDDPNVVPASPISATWWPNLQLAPSGGHIWNFCKWFHLVAIGQIYNKYNWCHLMVKFGTDVSGVTWWPNGSQICSQCNEHFEGEIVPAYSIVWRDLLYIARGTTDPEISGKTFWILLNFPNFSAQNRWGPF